MRNNLSKGGLIVSCQALKTEPLYSQKIMARMAYAAKLGGAKAIRANTVKDIKAIMSQVDLPIVGLIKRDYSNSPVYITPTLDEVKQLLKTKCHIIATDATLRPRPKGIALKDIVDYVRKNAPDIKLMADISTEDEAINAEKLGFDYISTTLRGYTEYTKDIEIPDIDFVKKLAECLSTPIIAEGGIWTLEQLDKIMQAGAYTVVIGQAITRPQNITARFNMIMNKYNAGEEQ